MTDALMSLAATGLFAARWTTRIEQEWIAALARRRPDLAGRLDVRRDAMREAVPDRQVPEHAWRPVAQALTLPDPDDTHVLAAAIAGHADCIVTTNPRDFPAAVVAAYGIEMVDPDRFIVGQWDLDPAVAIAAFRDMRARWRKPEASAEDFACAPERGGPRLSAQRVREAAERLADSRTFASGNL